MKSIDIKRMTLTSMFIALGLVLPLLTGQIPEIGNMLLPMHIPVMLCGLVCGWRYGCAAGFITPLFRSLIFPLPVLFPNAIGMAFELATYGLVIGLLYGLLKGNKIAKVYISLLASMLAGRAVWGLAMTVLLGFWGNGFALSVFWTNGFVIAVPGIILQLILIPAIITLIDKLGLMKSLGK